MLCAVVVIRMGDRQGCRLLYRAYLVDSDSARQTASQRRISDVASCRCALAAVLAKNVLCELLVSALLAALDVVSCML
jgi:hypothetical protein